MDRITRLALSKIARLCKLNESAKEELFKANDGGPGSGNWGHKGRPGKVGGSGPGGGRQYRGGRSDVGYFNSREDWLNGLTGETQHEATKKLRKIKEKISDTQNGIDRMRGLVDKGKIDQDEFDRWLKEKKLDKFDSRMSPEDFVMKCGSLEDRRQLLDMVGKARSWDKRGFHLQRENLSPDEKRDLFFMAAYSLSNPEVQRELDEDEWMNANADRFFDEMTDEEKERYLDLKAKALGLPNSEKPVEDYSEEMRVLMGRKKDPKRQVIPEKDSDNADWTDRIDEDDDSLKKALAVFEKAGIDIHKGYNGSIDMNEAEKELLEKYKEALESGDVPTVLGTMNYLERKEKLLHGDFYNKLLQTDDYEKDVKVGRIGRYHGEDMIRALRAYNKSSDNPLDEKTELDKIERNFLMDDSVSNEAKVGYMTLKAAALGMPPPSTGRDEIDRLRMQKFRNPLRDYARDRETELADKKRAEWEAERERKRNEAIKAYNHDKQQHDVVIKGDSFSEKIASMRKPEGVYTPTEIKDIGKVFFDEAKSAIEDSKIKAAELESEKDAAYDEWKENRLRLIQEKGYEAAVQSQEYSDLRKEYEKKRTEIDKKIKEIENPILPFLKRIRKVGVPESVKPKEMKEHLPGRSTVKKFVQGCYDNYPTAWVMKSLAFGPISTKKTSRGHCSWDGTEIAISGWSDDSMSSTATHEMGHRYETVIPGIKEAEKDFYDRRTAGEKLESLRSLTGNPNYRSDERARKDNFIDAYMGKDYGDKSYELVSMGFQYAFHNPKKLMGDPDYAHFIFGLLAVA